MEQLKQIEDAIEELRPKCTDATSVAANLLDDAHARCLGARALLDAGDPDDGKGVLGFVLTPAQRLVAYAARDTALALEALARERKKEA